MANNNEESIDQNKYWSPHDLVELSPRRWNLDRRDFLKATSVAAGAGTLGAGNATAASSSAVNAKTRPTIWTDQDRQNSRDNIQKYDWAKSQRDSAVDLADQLLAGFDGLDGLWHFVPAQTVPRSAFVSPNAGWDNEYYESWNDLEDPWKVSDGEYVFPTNDFKSYRESGLDDKGMFDPALADDQYLVNEEHPEMGEGWGVDDGYGWQDKNNDLGQGKGTYWTFVAYYNHWAVWRPGGVVDLMRALTDAYLLTGNQEYSRPCAVLLDRIGDVYPDMDVSAYRDPRAGGHYHNITGGRQTGKIIGSHWEPNLIRPVLRAYDAIFPGMENDQQLVDFLDQKTTEYPALSSKSTVGEIRKNIEDGILREILPAAKESQLAPGRGQLPSVTISARVLDEPNGYTRRALDWVFQPGSEVFNGDVWYKEPDAWETTGGNVLAKIVDREGRDGYFDQVAPLYNPIEQASVLDIGDLLQGYDGFEGADLYDHPKFHRMMHTHIPLIMLDEFTPLIGDSHPDRLYLNEDSKRNAFQVYGEDIFGQTIHFVNGFSTDGLRGDIFSQDPTQLREDVEAVIQAEGPLDMGSTIQPSYGFTALRDGENYKVTNGGEGDSATASNSAASQNTTTYSALSQNIVEASTGVRYDTRGNALQLRATSADQYLTLEFDVTESGTYQFAIRPEKTANSGMYSVQIDGREIGTYDFSAEISSRTVTTADSDTAKPATENIVDLPHPDDANAVAQYGFDTFDRAVTLSSGTHTITFENTGTGEHSSSYKMGLVQFRALEQNAGVKARQAPENVNAKRGVWTYYGRTGDYGNHTHKDTLNLGVMAHELNLAPDNGYPTFTGSWPRRRYWHKNTIAHNTVMVDEQRQESTRVGDPKHFDDTEMVQLSDVAAPDVYPQTDEYRRTTAMIHVDALNSYAVDFFHVDGGDDHRFSFHSWVGDVATEGLDLVEQGGGTYAGPDVPKPDNVANPDSEYNEQVGNGFNYLDNVSRDRHPAAKTSVDWDIEDYWNNRDDDANVHLRLSMLGEYDEIAVMDGHPPDTDDQPETIKYTIAQRAGNDLSSTFTSVIEPYVADRFVDSVTQVPVEMIPDDDDGDDGEEEEELPDEFEVDDAVAAPSSVRAVKVELTNGRTDYVVKTDSSDTLYTVDRRFQVKGFFAVISVENDEPVHAYLNDGTHVRPIHPENEDDKEVHDEYDAGRPLIQRPYGRFTGTLEDFSREMTLKNELTVKVNGHADAINRAVGGQIYVQNDGLVNGVYPVHGTSPDSGNRVKIDVGERTTIHKYKNPEELADGGYEYYLSEGESFYIPLSTMWSPE